MAANKFMATLAKTLFLAIPLVIAYMFGVYWLFSWLSNDQGMAVPRWLLSLVTLVGIYVIVAKILGSDFREMKQRHELKKNGTPHG